MKAGVWFVEIVGAHIVDNVLDILDNELRDAFMFGNKLFIVMNAATSYAIINETAPNIFNSTTLARYENMEVLISESLQDNEFRIG